MADFNEAIDIIANSDQEDFDWAIKMLKAKMAEDAEKQNKNQFDEVLRYSILEKIDDLCIEYDQKMVTDKMLPKIFSDIDSWFK